MDPGILAAIVILGVELVIVIIVIAYLFYNGKSRSRRSPIPESGEYTKKENNAPDTVEKVDEVKSEEEETTAPDSSVNGEPNELANISAPCSNQILEDKPDTTEYKPERNEKNEDKIQKKSVSECDCSSLDEGVGDVEKVPQTESSESSSSSSSSSEEEEKEEEEDVQKSSNEEVEPGKQQEEKKQESASEEKTKSSSESSSSSSSEDEKETDKTEKEKLATEPPKVEEDPQESPQNNTSSLEKGITLSLRVDNGKLVQKEKSSSSSTSSSSDSDQIQVIRTYDRAPNRSRTRESDDLAIVYDPVRHTVVNMDELKMSGESFSSSESEEDSDGATTGDEVVAGIINVTSGEKLTICQAITKGLIPEKTGLLLLEAQAATGSVVNPRTGVKLSVTDAVKQGVVDSKYKVTLSASEGAYYGYLDPRKDESVPLFEAMRRGIFPRAQGMRLLEAQVATGGVIDPWTGNRYPLSVALKEGLIDQATAKVLKNPDEHADFFDPNTKQRFSYGDLLNKCIRDLNTGLKFLYIEEKPTTTFSHYQPDLLTFRSAFRRKVSFQELIDAGLVDSRTLELFSKGMLGKEELREKMKPYLTGEQPIAGIYNRSTNEVLTICQAAKSGILRKSTAIELLEAQAATGNMIDPKSGKLMSVSRAVSIGLVDKQYANALRKAELAVLGYHSGNNTQAISLFEAMKRGIVIEVQGLRLLDSQLATGGLIDPVGGYRIPVDIAMKRGMIDQRLADALAHPTADQKGYYDPNTGENVTYSELLRRSVVDKKKNVGMRLLPVNDKSPNVRVVSKGHTRSRKIVIMNPSTRKPMTLKQAVAANIIDSETARNLQLHQGSWTART